MAEWWLETPWRMIQTNLREYDLKDLDPVKFAENLQEMDATVVMVSTSGIVANYPTKLPYHTRNAYASDDVLTEVIKQCHQRGIRVIGRMDFSKVREPMSSEHPEWHFVGETGHHVCYNGDTHVCCNSFYQRMLSLEILKETLEMIPLDGVFFNFGGYTSGYDYSGNIYGDCVCENCKQRFRDMFGEELPEHPSQSPLYGEFQKRTLDQAHREVRETIARVRPGICVANDYYSGAGFYRSEAGSALHSGDWMYSASDLAVRAKTGYPQMRASITSVDFIDIAYRYAAPSTQRQLVRMYQSMAHGGAMDLYIMGRIDNREDRQGLNAAREAFAWSKRYEDVYGSIISQAELLLVRPDAHWMGGGDALKDYRGWYEMLTQAHYLFDAVDASLIAAIDLKKYRTIIVPSYHLDDVRAEVLRVFAAEGGSVILTWGGHAVPTWSGVGVVTERSDDSRGGYVRVEPGDGMQTLKACDADVIPMIGGYTVCEPVQGAVGHQRIIAPHFYGPPERCYYTKISDHPAWMETPVGKGKAVWIPWKPGLSFASGRQASVSAWMSDLLCLTNAAIPLETDAPACVEISLARNQDGSLLVHLINLSGNAGGVWGKPLDIANVHVTLPCDKPVRVQMLDGGTFDWSWEASLLKLTVNLQKILTVIRIV